MIASDFPCQASDLRRQHLGSFIGVAGTFYTGRLMEVSIHESRRDTVRLRLMRGDRIIVNQDVAHDAIIVKRGKQ